MEKILMNLEPRATRTAGVAHTPPLGRQTSWHQCLTECQRVGRLLLVNARAETTVQLADGHVQSFRERTSVFSEVVGFMPVLRALSVADASRHPDCGVAWPDVIRTKRAVAHACWRHFKREAVRCTLQGKQRA